MDFIISTAFKYLLTHRDCLVLFTGGKRRGLDFLWGHFREHALRSESDMLTVEDDCVWVRKHVWQAIKVPYEKDRPEKFAGYFGEHSLVIVTDAHKMPKEVFAIFDSYLGLVLKINGSNV